MEYVARAPTPSLAPIVDDLYHLAGTPPYPRHQPPDEPEHRVTFLTCDLAEAVATARAAAGGKNLEILGADMASQCLRVLK
ncbi:MAG TPA: hypothetical protein VD903_02915 [Pseudonocardia sp.]|nr:hypothetical protein [Pseudonocardia sp.]